MMWYDDDSIHYSRHNQNTRPQHTQQKHRESDREIAVLFFENADSRTRIKKLVLTHFWFKI